jgi:cyclopropane-fatty-acyl-phospholipid synthase
MTQSIVPSEASSLEETRPSPFDALAKKVLYSLLRGLRRGQLTIVDGSEQRTFGHQSDDFPLEATIKVYHPRFYTSTLFGGSVGASESYMTGQWSADDLTTVVRILAVNREVLEGMEKGWARVTAPLHKFFHLLRSNTRKGSRINIAAHYDLGNDFYALFLDETLTYSCGIFEREGSTLKEASIAKYDLICKKLQLSAADHVVEIGT